MCAWVGTACEGGKGKHLPPPGSGACRCGTLSSTWCCRGEAAAVLVAPAAGPALTSFSFLLFFFFCLLMSVILGVESGPLCQ